MTKAELVEACSKKCGTSKAAANKCMDTMIDLMAKAIKKDKRLAIPGLGTFTVRKRKARMGRNPQTGEAIKIKASKTVGFKPAPQLKKGL